MFVPGITVLILLTQLRCVSSEKIPTDLGVKLTYIQVYKALLGCNKYKHTITYDAANVFIVSLDISPLWRRRRLNAGGELPPTSKHPAPDPLPSHTYLIHTYL